MQHTHIQISTIIDTNSNTHMDKITLVQLLKATSWGDTCTSEEGVSSANSPTKIALNRLNKHSETAFQYTDKNGKCFQKKLALEKAVGGY